MSALAYVGVDVQANRGCPYVVLDAGLRHHASGWLESPQGILSAVRDAAKALGAVAVGIDAPRCALPSPRPHYWSGHKWRARRPSETGYGRHCEVVLAALKIANPQWTPPLPASPEWMRTGFQLFEVLSGECEVYEVFPSASYCQLAEEREARFCVSLQGFAEGPKDMLDAYVAAFTVHEYLAGRGAEVGGGDGLGTIVLPRPASAGTLEGVLVWPAPENTPPNSHRS